MALRMSPLGLLRFRIGLYYPIRDTNAKFQQITQRLSEVYLLNEALMKEPLLESFSNTSLISNQRIAPPVYIYKK